MGSQTGQVERYFSAVNRALSGLDSFLGDKNSPLYKHKLIGQIVVPYVERLERDLCLLAEPHRLCRHVQDFPCGKRIFPPITTSWNWTTTGAEGGRPIGGTAPRPTGFAATWSTTF